MPHVRVGATDQVLCVNGIDVVTKSREDRNETVRQVFVEFDLHRFSGISIRGMFSCAEPAVIVTDSLLVSHGAF